MHGQNHIKTVLICRLRCLYRVGQLWEAVSVADKFTVLHISAVRRKAARETNNNMEAVTVPRSVRF